MHRGQNSASPESVVVAVVTVPSSAITTLSMPEPGQITSSFCGCTMGDATATPSVKANHSKAKRASQGELRKKCKKVMGRDYGTGLDSAFGVASCPPLGKLPGFPSADCLKVGAAQAP